MTLPVPLTKFVRRIWQRLKRKLRVNLHLEDHPVQIAQAAHRPAYIVQRRLVRLMGAGHHTNCAAVGRQLQLMDLLQNVREQIQVSFLRQQAEERLEGLQSSQRGSRADELFFSPPPAPRSW